MPARRGVRRRVILVLLAVVIGLKGAVYLQGGSPSTAASLRLLVERLGVPVDVCGIAIMGLCAAAAACALLGRGRDIAGYVILAAYSCGWAACYAASPLFLDGPTYAWQGTLSYVLIAGIVMLCAGDRG